MPAFPPRTKLPAVTIPSLWGELSRRLRTSAPYRALVEATGPVEVVRLPVPAAAWVVALAAAETGRSPLVVVPHESDAGAWIEAARLLAAEAGSEPVYFPGPSLSPYQETEPSLLVRAQEAVALDRLLAGGRTTLVTTPRALFRRLPSGDDFRAAAIGVDLGEELPREELIDHLASHGYRRTDLVTEIGDLAVRGGLLDVWPPGHEDPLRIDFFGDTVDSVRRFDALSQRSEERVEGESESVRLLPLTLFPSGPTAAERVADALADMAGDRLTPEAAGQLTALRQQGGFPGWTHYLPLVARRTAGLAELAAEAAGGGEWPWVVAVDPPTLATETEHHAEMLDADFASRRNHHKLAAPPEALEESGETVAAVLAAAAVRVGGLILDPAHLREEGADGQPRRIDFAATTTDLFQGQLPRFPQEVATARARGDRVVVVTPSAHRRKLEELFEARSIERGADGVEISEGELARGFRLPAAGVSLYGEQQLLSRSRPQSAGRKRTRFGPFVSSLRDLKVGDYVVHVDHGIGQFVGLRKVGGSGAGGELPPALSGFGGGAANETEVMEIAYRSGKRLLVPLSRLDLVQKFSGIEGVAPRLDSLGGTSWNKTKAKVKKSLRDMAGELLKLYAARQVAEAPAMAEDSDLMRGFEAAFAYEETPDQTEAIAAVKSDLESVRPMDRLLCGDVGYGKTEVAMRAAFKVVDSGYQVAVLAPTTILADQHLETFRRRFAGFPVKIDMVSRFRTPAEIKTAIERLAAGD